MSRIGDRARQAFQQAGNAAKSVENRTREAVTQGTTCPPIAQRTPAVVIKDRFDAEVAHVRDVADKSLTCRQTPQPSLGAVVRDAFERVEERLANAMAGVSVRRGE